MGQTYPLPITDAMLAPANANAGKPRYDSMTDWAGGAGGDDVDEATATAAVANAASAVAVPDYTPRTQAAKVTAENPLAIDIGRARGAIAPDQRYPVAGDPAVAAPVITTLTPNTAPAGSPALVVVVTGTGFTPWTTIRTGGVPTDYVRYVSPTEIRLGIDARRSVAGIIDVIATDHNVDSASKPFTFT